MMMNDTGAPEGDDEMLDDESTPAPAAPAEGTEGDDEETPEQPSAM